jgi:hypothetical protein
MEKLHTFLIFFILSSFFSSIAIGKILRNLKEIYFYIKEHFVNHPNIPQVAIQHRMDSSIIKQHLWWNLHCNVQIIINRFNTYIFDNEIKYDFQNGRFYAVINGKSYQMAFSDETSKYQVSWQLEHVESNSQTFDVQIYDEDKFAEYKKVKLSTNSINILNLGCWEWSIFHRK